MSAMSQTLVIEPLHPQAFAPFGEVLDIGDAACGRLKAAEPRPQLVYLTGLAVQDLCAAAMIYEKSFPTFSAPST